MIDRPDVSIVMPCLDEREGLAHCIARAYEALEALAMRRGLTGEIIVADNGSTDGSQALARRLGARVIPVARRGYGAALRGGFEAARGRYLVMGDADGSYDFMDAVGMVEALTQGADLCIGSRFKGGIAPGAMPWKNRYIGNPILTGVLNLLFGAHIDDAHCGLRALTRACFGRLRLEGAGMEFASEMIIKATLLGERIVEVPATLARDLRGRPPHLRPWRDGWRHLRYILMLSPHWLFGAPAAFGFLIALAVLTAAGFNWALRPDQEVPLGNYWMIFGGALLTVSHIALILSLAGQLYGVKQRYRRPGPLAVALAPWLTLETMLVSGLLAIVAGAAVLTAVLVHWSANHGVRIDNVFPPVVGTALVAVGAQTVLGGFLLAIVGGNAADFLAQDSIVTEEHAAASRAAAEPSPVVPRIAP
jgi:glycosyltransferase involved in cell wall biosynthesis